MTLYLTDRPDLCIINVGKSVWIHYALRRRLAEKKPVIWYFEGTCYLFVEEGVYEVPDKCHQFEVFVWTLVDSDSSKDGILSCRTPAAL